ncbi:hypothetical protein N7532_008872 [Penicillium argentinense]|uniref:Uncharacterized protein n=1 Tax=Penicillium argentinense TaxID=1131581 RepID=A0A9W9EY75_9EURO|nr:uncharacterized protein N7532_008872 [Penicillium argentinense]KAJ5090188.1 hypothetical protein N7532_008872 [Penicillium argentinense]
MWLLTRRRETGSNERRGCAVDGAVMLVLNFPDHRATPSPIPFPSPHSETVRASRWTSGLATVRDQQAL